MPPIDKTLPTAAPHPTQPLRSVDTASPSPQPATLKKSMPVDELERSSREITSSSLQQASFSGPAQPTSGPNKGTALQTAPEGLPKSAGLETLIATWPVKSAGPNKFGVHFVNASALSDADGDAFFKGCSGLGEERNKVTLAVPKNWTIPEGFREVALGDVVTDQEGKKLDLPLGTRIVVAQESKVPQTLNGAKAAAHLSLTVQIELPYSIVAALQKNQGMTPKNFLTLTENIDDSTEKQKVSLLVSPRSGAIATTERYENTFSEFGGSADVVGDRLETAQEIAKRETEEEGGPALAGLLGQVRDKSKAKRTDIPLGGPYKVNVADDYHKLVSRKSVNLAELRPVLSRARGDDDEVVGFGVVLLPDLPIGLSEDDAKKALQQHFGGVSGKAQAALVRIAQKVYESADYPNVWTLEATAPKT